MNKIRAGKFIPIPVSPIVLVGVNVNEIANYSAVGFVNGVNVSPPIICISINNRHFSKEGILQNGTFSINIPTAEFVKETDYCGLVSGRNVDKSKLFTTFYGDVATAPMISEFPITCECRCVEKEIEFSIDTVIFGEIVQVYLNENILDGKKINLEKENIICFSGLENEYRLIGKEIGKGWNIGRELLTDIK